MGQATSRRMVDAATRKLRCMRQAYGYYRRRHGGWAGRRLAQGFGCGPARLLLGVLVPSFTTAGTINALVTNNLRPVFCDERLEVDQI